MSNTKITSHVIESGAVHTTHIASGAISAAHLTGVTTANITENTNLYYTDTRARSSISVTGGNLSYDNSTGVLQLTDSEIRDAISATSSGDGSLTYTAGTGVIAYTGPSASEVQAHLSAGTGVTYSGGQISIGQAVGTSDTVSFGNITTAGYLRGPANFTIDPAAYGDDTGTLIIAGNLQVDGTTTTINSTTLTVDDLNLTLASGAANAAAANGAGITVDGASATLLYQASGDKFIFNKGLDVTGNIGVTGTVDGVDIATRDAILTSTTTTAGAALPKAGGTMTGNLTIDKEDPNINLSDTSSSRTLAMFVDNNNSVVRASGPLLLQVGSQSAITIDASRNTVLAGTLGSGAITSTGAINLAGNIEGTGSTSAMKAPYIQATNAAIATYGGTTPTFHSPASGTAAFSMNGGERMRIDSSGNVGIDNNSPAHRLHIQGNTNTLARVRVSNTAGGQASLDLNNSEGYFRTYTDNGEYRIYDQTDGVNRLCIDTSGKVGIGDDAPQDFLEVRGTSSSLGGITISNGAHNHAALSFARSSTATARIFTSEPAALHTSSLHFQTSTAASGPTLVTAMTIDESQNVGIGTTAPSKSLSVKAPSGSNGGIDVFHNNGNKVAELVHHGSGDEGRLSLYDGGTGTVQLHGETGQPSYINSGNVGIGTTAPSYKFDVYGTDDITMRIHRPSSGLALTDTCGIGFSQRGDNNTSSSDTRAAIVSTYNGSLHLCTEPGGNLNSNPVDHAALSIIGTTQNVGIGTTSPAQKLHVQGTTSIIRVQSTSANANASIWFNSNVGGTQANRWEIGTNISAGGDLEVYDRLNGASRMVIEPSGNVGIGTIAPTMPLSVQAASNAYAISMHGRSDGYSELYGASNDGSTKYSFLQSHSAQTKLYTLVNTPLLFGTNSTERMRLSAAGDLQLKSGAVNKGYIQLSTQSTSYALMGGNHWGYLGYKTGGYHRWFGSDGVEDMRLDSSGNLAIATTSPDSSASMGGQTPKLTVDGYTSLDGLRVAGSDTGNTIYKTGGNMGIVSASHALNASGNTQLNLSAGGNTMFRGTPNHWSLGAGNYPHGRVRTFHYHASLNAGQTVALLQNTGAHTDVNFIYWIEAFHSSRSYRTGMGTFGGYGMHKTSAGFGLDIYGTSAGTGIQRLDIQANTSYATSYHISMLIFGDSGITVHNGTMSDQI